MGLGLREVHVATNVDTDGRTSSQIEDAMKTQGQRALDSKIINETFTFSTDAESPFIYRTDYDVGDQVHINHIAWDISLALRIVEIEEDYAGGSREIVLTCGSPLPEIIDFEEGSSCQSMLRNTAISSIVTAETERITRTASKHGCGLSSSVAFSRAVSRYRHRILRI
jgi:hypothetical protein